MHRWIFEPESKDYLYFQQFVYYVELHSRMMINKLEGILKASKQLKQQISEEINLLDK